MKNLKVTTKKEEVKSNIAKTKMRLENHLSLAETKKQISLCIETENPEALGDLMKNTFVYTDWQQSEVSLYGADSAFNPPQHFHHYKGGKVLDMLLMHDIDYLKNTIKQLIEKDNGLMYEAFMKSFPNLDNEFKIWFGPIDETQEKTLEQKIQKLEDYADKIDSEAPEKKASADALCKTLREKLPLLKKSDDANTTKFERLKAKLDFLIALRQEDKTLNVRRGYLNKCTATNAATLLATAGIANIVQGVKTGNPLFARNTTSKDILVGMEKVLVGNTQWKTPVETNGKPTNASVFSRVISSFRR